LAKLSFLTATTKIHPLTEHPTGTLHGTTGLHTGTVTFFTPPYGTFLLTHKTVTFSTWVPFNEQHRTNGFNEPWVYFLDTHRNTDLTFSFLYFTPQNGI